ncbi:MAG: hypothetical protein ACRD5J_00790 [Nitrososphaeraceae archaeon]
MTGILRAFQVGTIITASSLIFAGMVPNYEINLIPPGIAHSGGALTIKHDIQTKDQSNSCIYSVSILVFESETLKRVSNASVEFKTPVTGIVTNKTDSSGSTVVSLTLEKQPQQKNCTETLLSRGYSIEVFSQGYVGQGIGTIS